MSPPGLLPGTGGALARTYGRAYVWYDGTVARESIPVSKCTPYQLTIRDPSPLKLRSPPSGGGLTGLSKVLHPARAHQLKVKLG